MSDVQQPASGSTHDSSAGIDTALQQQRTSSSDDEEASDIGGSFGNMAEARTSMTSVHSLQSLPSSSPQERDAESSREGKDGAMNTEQETSEDIASKHTESLRSRPEPLSKTWEQRWFGNPLPGPNPEWTYNMPNSSKQFTRAYKRPFDPKNPEESERIVFTRQDQAPYTATGLSWAQNPQAQAKFIMSRHDDAVRAERDELQRKLRRAEERRFYARMLRVREATLNWFFDRFEKTDSSIRAGIASIISMTGTVITSFGVFLHAVIHVIRVVLSAIGSQAHWIFICLLAAFIGWGLTHDWLVWNDIPSSPTKISSFELRTSSYRFPATYKISSRALPWYRELRNWLAAKVAPGYFSSIPRITDDFRTIAALVFVAMALLTVLLVPKIFDGLLNFSTRANAVAGKGMTMAQTGATNFLGYIWLLIYYGSIAVSEYIKDTTSNAGRYLSGLFGNFKDLIRSILDYIKTVPSKANWAIRNPVSSFVFLITEGTFSTICSVLLFGGNIILLIVKLIETWFKILVGALKKAADITFMLPTKLGYYWICFKSAVLNAMGCLSGWVREIWREIKSGSIGNFAKGLSWTTFFILWTVSIFAVGFFCGLGFKDFYDGFENVLIHVEPCV